jgi:hypothetical protein
MKMTLVLTEMSPFGIAMAADSAVTFTNPQTGLRYAEPDLARKLQPIPYLNAGISCWGMGEISDTPTDTWINNFIDSHRTVTSLMAFAQQLAETLNTQLPPNTDGTNRLGFHVAGYENYNGAPTPSFYHVHDGSSTTLAQRGIVINPNQVNANHDMPPEIFQQTQARGLGWITRNGDYQLYATIFGLLEDFFHKLTPLGIRIPNSQNLNERAEYLVFQIRTVSEIYRLSNLVPGIGGTIYFLTINPDGIYSQGTKHF